MAGNEKDGYYCSICGGIPPDKIKTKKVLIDGKETGIDHLDFIFENVKKLHLTDDATLARRDRETGQRVQLRADEEGSPVCSGLAERIPAVGAGECLTAVPVLQTSAPLRLP